MHIEARISTTEKQEIEAKDWKIEKKLNKRVRGKQRKRKANTKPVKLNRPRNPMLLHTNCHDTIKPLDFQKRGSKIHANIKLAKN